MVITGLTVPTLAVWHCLVLVLHVQNFQAGPLKWPFEQLLWLQHARDESWSSLSSCQLLGGAGKGMSPAGTHTDSLHSEDKTPTRLRATPTK